MRITLTRRGDYAVRAAFDLAAHHPVRRNTAEIAEAMHIPKAFLSRVTTGLVRAGLLISTAGPGGGYTLARPPADISLLEVVEAVEGELALRECVLRGGPCGWENRCAVHDPWADAQQAFRQVLTGTSLADLTAGKRI